ncbi:MAG TPA: NrsF family protein [Stellaceae bacterium]|nr:NrsF family protein [Stellaceae bacterium]
MPLSTDLLIARLAASAAPVRRLRPPLLRAAFWLAGVAAVAAVVVPLYGDFALFDRRMQDAKFVIELAGTLLTGIAAVIAAFQLSVPDRSPAWAWLPVPPLILWLAASGYNCWRDWIAVGDHGWRLGESAACFATIVGFSIPLGATLLFFLARAKPLAPMPVAALGGLGVAGLAAFFLDFNHPIDASFLDLGWHVAAVGLVIGCTALAGRWRDAANAQAGRPSER